MTLVLPVIGSITSVEQGEQELPRLLQSDSPPKAIVVGGNYDEAASAAMRQACRGAGPEVLWLFHARETGSAPVVGPGLAEDVVRRVKAKLGEVMASGETEGTWKF